MLFGKILNAPWWKAPIPKGWHAYFDEIATFEPRITMDSALQIGCGRKTQGQVKESEIRDQIELFCPKPRAEIRRITLGVLTGCTCDEIKEDNTFWRYWILKNGPFLFRVTYNCESNKEGRDEIICNQIIKSIIIK